LTHVYDTYSTLTDCYSTLLVMDTATAAGTVSGLNHSGDSLNVSPVPRPTLVRIPALLYWRLERGLTQQELADRSSVGRASIARLENGSEARISTVAKLAKALAVEPSDLRRQPPEEP
jgi:DNA-binding Xre family transcriptional regulator